ncbi:Rib/alpha-like domain-containing protein [Staphylococcus sp. 11261D007BR]
MRNNRKVKKGRIDFLPNRANKYSIRRFTVGTASILIGATLIFGTGQETKAAEETNTTPQQTEENPTEPQTTEQQTAEQPTQEQGTDKEVTTEQPVDGVQPTDGDKTGEAPAEQPTVEDPTVEESTQESATQPVEGTQSTDGDKTGEAPAEQPTVEDPTVEESTQESATQPVEGTQSTDGDKTGETPAEQQTVEEPTGEGTEQPVDGVQSTDSDKTGEASAEQPTVEDPTDKQSAGETDTAGQLEQQPDVTGEEEQFPEEELPSAESYFTSDYDQLTSADDKSAYTKQYLLDNSTLTADEVDNKLNELNIDFENATSNDVFASLLQNFSNDAKKYSPEALQVSEKDALTDDETISLANNTTEQLKSVLPLDSEGNIDESKIIDADAIANGYINSQTDATNAANTLSGRAWEVDKGTPATMSNGLTAVPENTPVYMQWIDEDGAVSPVYRAHTTNQLSNDGGSQVGPGAYAFDLREGWVDANGNEHKYNATDGQYYKLWIQDYENEAGNTMSMFRQSGGFFPGSYVNSVTGSNLGQFPLIGTNMQRTGIYMYEQPTEGYMTKDESEWITDTEGPLSDPAVALRAKNSVSGKVWLETGDGDRANSATGPSDNRNDPQAEGYNVVFSSLTDEGAAAYEAQVNSLPESERNEAAKELLTANPDFISATVTGKTDADGRYTVRFPEGTLNDDYLYGYVTDPDGNIVQSYSSFTSAEFRKPNSNLSWTPQTAPAQNIVANPMWYNVNFAVVPQTELGLDVLEYDAVDNPATPEVDQVKVDLTGSSVSPLPMKVEWSRDGGAFKSIDINNIQDAEAASTLIFDQLDTPPKDGEIFTARLYEGDNVIDSDSFIYKVTQASEYDPTTDGIEKQYGNPTTEDEVTNAVTIPNYPVDEEAPTITVDDPTTLPDGTTPGTKDVPVTVTYPDGSEDKVTVPVTTAEQPQTDVYEPTTDGIEKQYGNPTTEEDVTNAVTIPDYPTDGEAPTITVDDPTTLPDGTTPGTKDVPVTVTYPDGTTDQITVPVTTGEQPQTDVYEPTTDGVEKPYGEAPTEADVTGSVTIPGYPEGEDAPTITVDDPTTLPDGTTPGTKDVPVTVTYPDGTTDNITVPVTTGEQPQNDVYEPSTDGIEKQYGNPTTEQDVTNAVTIPDYPTDGEAPTITVDDPTTLPDGTTPGTTDVPVTVTYPDGTTDQITVPVTTGEQPQTDVYEPTTDGVEKPYGEAPTEADVTGSVTIPGYPEGEDAPTITVDDPTTLPDGTTPGTTDVPVTVTYPDGTTDNITVPVTTGEQPQNDVYEPTTDGIEKQYGNPTTEEDVTNAVTIPDYPTDGEAPTITVDDPTTLPDGTTPGTTDVPVTVTYPDGTTDHITVPVTTGGQEQTELPTPTVDPVDENDTTVSGTNGTPGNTIVVTWPDQSTTETTVDDEGNWSVEVPDQVDLNEGDNITVVEQDEDGNTSDETTVTVGKDTTTGMNGQDDNTDGDSDVATGDNTNADDNTDVENDENMSSDNNNATENNANNNDQLDDTTGDDTLANDNDNNATDNTDQNGNTNAQIDDNVSNDPNVNGTNNAANDTNANGVNQNNAAQSSDKDNKEEVLPETGQESDNKGTLFGGLFAALGGLLLFGRRKRNKEEK